MYYRRKIFLAVLQSFGSKLSSIDLQKFVFLLSRDQSKPSYDFIPHNFGCYSFQLDDDCEILESKQILLKSKGYWTLNDGVDYISMLNSVDQGNLRSLVLKYGKYRGDNLVRLVYQQHPYYAIKSKIAKKLLTKHELEIVTSLSPPVSSTTIATIGYEGISIDAFLEKLIKNDIKHLCDVRMNASSMKRGFSKSKLKNYLEHIGVSYSHHPLLGIESSKRKKTAEEDAWDELFLQYESSLHLKNDQISDILSLLDQKKTIALMCFEHQSCDCHRGRLVKYMTEYSRKDFSVTHL